MTILIGLSRVGGGVADADGVGEQGGVGDEDAVAVLAVDHRGAHLDIGDGAFDSGDADPVADAERLVEQDQNAGEKILQDVLKGEANGHAADAEHLAEAGEGGGSAVGDSM
jgi:hypothetical protein